MCGKEYLAPEQVTKLNITKLIEAEAFLIKEMQKAEEMTMSGGFWVWVRRRPVRAGAQAAVEERAGWKSASSWSEPSRLAKAIRAGNCLVRAGLPMPWSSEPANTMVVRAKLACLVRASQLVGGEPPDQSLGTLGVITALVEARAELRH